MEYFTSKEQESQFTERYRKRVEQEQDRIRFSFYRIQSGTSQEIPEDDRIFFVEQDGVYMGEVKPENKCPSYLMEGGAYYGIDNVFLQEATTFIQHHSRYVVIFHIKRGYSRHAGIFPARMIAEQEEIMLESSLE